MFLNTKEDYRNTLKDNRQEGIAKLQELLDDRYTWQVTSVLAKKEDGLDDVTHMVVESGEDFLQLQLKEDSNARLFMLGFTVEEVEQWINNPDEVQE